jgi:hypothetical protein
MYYVVQSYVLQSQKTIIRLGKNNLHKHKKIK